MTTNTNTAHIDPRRVPHSVAVAARDEAVLAAATYFRGGIRPRAMALAAALEAYRAAEYWPAMRGRREPPEGASPRTAALHAILYLDRGRALSADHIERIVEKAI